MALVFMDSFDHYATNDILKKWDYAGGYTWGSNSIDSSLQRRAGTKYYWAYDHWIEKDIVDSVTGLDIYTFVAGFVCHYQTNCPNMYINLTTANREIQIQVSVTSDGKVHIYRDNILLEETPQDYVSPNTWFHIEVKVVLHDTTGSYEVRLNEVNVLSGSGIDTKAFSGGVAKIRLGGGYYAQGCGGFDDFFLLDGNASDDPANPNNDFLGDCRIDALLPNAPGTYTQYSSNQSESANWENVDDPDGSGSIGLGDIDDDATFNQSKYVDKKETYNVENIASLGTSIYAVATNSCCRKTDAGRKYFKQLTRSGSTDHLSEEKHLTDFYKVYQKTLDVNPADSLAWEEDDINAVESGTIVTL